MNADDLAYRLIMEYQNLSSNTQRQTFYKKHYKEVKEFVLTHSSVVRFLILFTRCKNGATGYKTILYREHGVINNRIAYSSRATALMSIFYAVWQKDKLV